MSAEPRSAASEAPRPLAAALGDASALPPSARAAGGGPRGPWAFVPLLYLQQGAHYFLVDTALGTFLTSMGVDLPRIGHASTLVTLPWSLKALWSPLVEFFGTKRAWILASELVVLVGALLLAAAPVRADWFTWTIVACTVIALAGATADIATDGFYILALSKDRQSAFVGVRNACFRLGRIAVASGAGEIAGWLIESGEGRAGAWSVAFLCAGALYAAGLACIAWLLPKPAADRAFRREERAAGAPFFALLGQYFRQPSIVAVLAFIFVYRLGESMLTSMVAPFLQRPVEQGGMGLTVAEFARAYSAVGVVALLAGGLLGGAWIARRGLAACLWPMAIAMHAPNLLFYWAAHEHPGKGAVFALVATEQAAYGFGFSAYMVFLMRIAQRSSAPTAHYAISTGFMGLAAMLAKYWSGDLAEALGFTGFFAFVCAAAIPGLGVLPFLPIDAREPAPPRAPGST